MTLTTKKLAMAVPQWEPWLSRSNRRSILSLACKLNVDVAGQLECLFDYKEEMASWIKNSGHVCGLD